MRARGTTTARFQDVRRGLTLTWIVLFIASILLQYGSFANPSTALGATGLKAGTVQGFEVDGDLISGNASTNPGGITPTSLIDGFPMANGVDWLGTGGVVNPATPPISTVTHDLISSTSDDGYGGGSKETDTRTWSYDLHKSTPKDDVEYAMAYAKFVGTSAFFYAGATRIVNNGDTHIDFELNKNPFKVYSDGISKPDRSVGDILVSLEFSNGGSDPIVTVYKVTAIANYPTGQDTTYGTDVATTAAVHSATNFVALPDQGIGAIPTFEFAETSIDLSALGINTGCPGLSNGHIRTRSGGDLDASQLKDNIQPFPIDLNNCGKIRIEKHAGTIDGALLGGATFTVVDDPRPGLTGTLTITDNGAGDLNPAAGIIDIDPAEPGTYTICETVPPTGYNLPNPACQSGVVVPPNGSVTVKFADPRKTATTTLVVAGANPANGSFVTVGQSISLTVTETNTGQSTLHNVAVGGTNSCANWTPAANKNGGGAFAGTLAAGESVNFTCTFNAPNVSNFAWSATATGLDELNSAHDPTGETVGGSYDILQPATLLTIVQNAPAQVHAGDSVTIIVNEKNDGEGTITSVHVDGTGPCAGNWVASGTKVGGGAFTGSLAPGESVNFTCAFSAPASDFTWAADGKGTDALGHAVPTTNEHQAGSVDVVSPSTLLTLRSAPTKVHAGDTITVVVRETNTGDGPLTNVHVVAGGDCASFSPASVPSLAPAAFQDFTCTITTTAGDGTDKSWTADGKGTDALGAPAPEDNNEHQQGSVIVIAPATTLTPVSAPTQVLHDTQVTIVVKETNTGDDTLTSVNVTGTNSCANWTAAANKDNGAGAFAGSLAPGESVNFSCTFTVGTSDVHWTALGHGTDSLGSAVPSTNEDEAGDIDVINPATTLTIKTDAPAKVYPGDSIHIVVTETNSGDAALHNVTVTGTNSCANWTAVGAFSGNLAPSASQDFECTFNAPADDFGWSATGHGLDALQNAAPATGETVSGQVEVLNPSTILTIKTNAPAKVYPGDSIHIVVTETNDGDSTLTNVSVTGTNSCANWTAVGTFSGTLQPSESQDFECTFNAPADDFSWSATAHALDELENPAPADDETVGGRVEVLNPATTMSIKNDAPAQVHAGDSIHIVVTETNSGDSTLTNVNVTGTNSCANWAAVGVFGGTLEPGESQDFECTFNAPADDFSWTATGHGVDELQNAAPDDNETVGGDVEVLNPATTLTLVSEIPDPVLAHGSTTITVRETNVGDTPLSNVHVTGAPCADWTPVDAGFDGTLAIGAHEDFTCTVADVGTANVVWNALGHGLDPLEAAVPLTNEDEAGSVHVVNPDIDVVKTAGPSMGDQVADGAVYETEDGTTVVYKYVVTTQDPDGLTDVSVSDDICSPVTAVESGGFNVGDTDSNDILKPGESWVFSCSTLLSIGEDGVHVHNIATASGQPIVGSRVDDQDDADVTLLTPDISIVKTAGDAADGAVYVTEAFPDNVTYHYAITNTGELDLFNVTVVDDLGTVSTADDITVCTIESLPVDATENCQVTLTVNVDTTNVAKATGHTAQRPDDDVSADDDAEVEIVVPGIEIIKTAGDAADGGVFVTESFTDNVTYHYAVTNTGQVDLFNVAVVDDAGTPGDTSDDIDVCTIESLPVEATENCQVTITVTHSTTNVAVATGHTEQQPNENVSDDDDAIVRVPDVSIGKSNDDEDGVVGHGQTVTYTIDVTVFEGPVTDAVVTDSLPDGQSYVADSQTSDPAATFEVSADGRTLTWSWESLAEGAHITYQVTIDGRADTGSQTNTATICVSELENCKPSDSTVEVPDLTIAKSYTGNTGGSATNGMGIAKVGDTLTYTLAYDLTGGPVTGGVITDTLPTGLTYVAGSATDNDEFTFVSYDAGTRTLTWTAPTVSEDGSVTYRVTVDEGSFNLPQPLVNVATIDSNETDKDQDSENVLVQEVKGETSPPTLPPTDSIDHGGQAPSNPGFGLMLTLLVIAGIGLLAGYLTPTPGRPRREPARRR